jgi:hypothetical protein
MHFNCQQVWIALALLKDLNTLPSPRVSVASHKAIIVLDGFIGLPLAVDAAATAIPGRLFSLSIVHRRMLRSSTLRFRAFG